MKSAPGIKICAVTMVRNDDFFLRKWTEYYGREFGEENLYIFLDGKDQPLPSWCPASHVEAVEKIPGKVVEAEKGRLDFLSDTAARLLREYDLVVGTDADEFLVVDPKLGLSLRDYLAKADIKGSLSGLGIDVGQNLSKEGVLTADRPFLSQRHCAHLSTRYTKPSVLSRPYRWGRGFHRVKGHNFKIGKGLYLFHFGYSDLELIKARLGDADRAAAGWTKHLKKRSRTINYCTKGLKRDWDSTVPFVRILESVIRPPYAWNKPALAGMTFVVRIPERFDKIL